VKNLIPREKSDPIPKKLVGIRLSEDILGRMQIIANNRGISVNNLINKALIQWMQSFSYSKKLKYLMLTKDMFKSLIHKDYS